MNIHQALEKKANRVAKLLGSSLSAPYSRRHGYLYQTVIQQNYLQDPSRDQFVLTP